jgi:hypothetical protein
MRKLIPLVILLLIAISAYATDFTVYSKVWETGMGLPYAEVDIYIEGQTYHGHTDINGKLDFHYNITNETQWTSSVYKENWSPIEPASGFITTSVSETEHTHFLSRDNE